MFRFSPRVELALIVGAALVTFAFAAWLNAFERFVEWSQANEDWQMDELLILAVVLMVAFALVAWRRWRELRAEVAARLQLEADPGARAAVRARGFESLSTR